MNEIAVLTRLELRSLYGINQFRYTKDKKAKRRARAMAVVWILLGLVIFTYVGGLVYGLSSLGLADIVPSYLVMISSLLIFAFGIFKAGSTIFSSKGYDLLSSMPLRASSIVMSRFIAMYVEDWLFAMMVMLPGTIVYGICQRPDWPFYGVALLGVFFIPLLPLVISTALGSLITALSCRMKHKSLVQTILSLGLLVGFLLATFRMPSATEEFSPEKLAALASTVAELIHKIYVPAVWLGDAMIRWNVGEGLLFVGISVGAMAAMFVLVSTYYHRIARRMLVTSARHTYRMGTLKRSHAWAALYRREVKRYFASSIYVMNTIIGPIMAMGMAIALVVVGMDALRAALPIDLDWNSVIPFAFSAIFTMMTTTSVSLSMEGKTFWIVKTLPLSTKRILDAKIALNLSLIAPFYLISEVLLAIALRPNFAEWLWLMGIPTLIIIFAVVFGITVNLKLHSFTWDREERIVKQSASAAIGGFSGFLLSILLGVVTFLLSGSYGVLVKIAICALLAVSTWALYQKNNRADFTFLG